MKRVVKTENLDEALVLVANAVGKVVDQVLGLVDGRGLSAVSVDVVEDAGGNGEDLGGEVKGVLESGLPVVSLGHTSGVALGEGRVVAERHGQPDQRNVVYKRRLTSAQRRQRRTGSWGGETWLWDTRVSKHPSYDQEERHIRKESMICLMLSEISERLARSAVNCLVSSAVGTLPVRRYQSMDSGSICLPPGAAGRTSWHSCRHKHFCKNQPPALGCDLSK